MKKLSLIPVAIILGWIMLYYGCKKADENTGSTNIKKYAWVTGEVDNTGYGTILFTPDGGISWERQGLGQAVFENTKVSDIWPVDENTIWACGGQNSIFKSTNAGQNWTAIYPGGKKEIELTRIHKSKNNTMWVCGEPGSVYKSTNNGKNWEIIQSEVLQGKYLQGIWEYTNNVVYTVGGVDQGTDAGFIAYTKDGGISWDSITPADNYNEHEWIGVVSFGENIVIYGQHSFYIVSYDGGQSWNNDSVVVKGEKPLSDINDMIMLDKNTWWSAMDMGYICITKDAGKNWTRQKSPQNASGYLVGIDTYDGKLALIVSANFYIPPISPIIRTEDGGSNWDSVYTHDNQLWKVSFIKD